MQYGWRVPHNTISIVVREVCEAIIHEYRDEMLAPPQTAAEWREITDNWLNRWNFPHVVGAIDGKHIACKAPANRPTGSNYFNYKGFFSVILLAVVSSDYKFIWADVSGKGLPLMHTYTTRVIFVKACRTTTFLHSRSLIPFQVTLKMYLTFYTRARQAVQSPIGSDSNVFGTRISSATNAD